MFYPFHVCVSIYVQAPLCSDLFSVSLKATPLFVAGSSQRPSSDSTIRTAFGLAPTIHGAKLSSCSPTRIVVLSRWLHEREKRTCWWCLKTPQSADLVSTSRINLGGDISHRTSRRYARHAPISGSITQTMETTMNGRPCYWRPRPSMSATLAKLANSQRSSHMKKSLPTFPPSGLRLKILNSSIGQMCQKLHFFSLPL